MAKFLVTAISPAFHCESRAIAAHTLRHIRRIAPVARKSRNSAYELASIALEGNISFVSLTATITGIGSACYLLAERAAMLNMQQIGMRTTLDVKL